MHLARAPAWRLAGADWSGGGLHGQGRLAQPTEAANWSLLCALRAHCSDSTLCPAHRTQRPTRPNLLLLLSIQTETHISSNKAKAGGAWLRVTVSGHWW